MEERIVVILNLAKLKRKIDIEIPLEISARELVIGLNSAFNLGIDVEDIKNCYLKVENPIMLLRGNMILRDSGIRSGSTINYTE